MVLYEYRPINRALDTAPVTVKEKQRRRNTNKNVSRDIALSVAAGVLLGFGLSLVNRYGGGFGIEDTALQAN